jgi:hypothetical protein
VSTNGYWSLQGYQTETAAVGRSNLGPFNVPFGPVTELLTESLVPGTLTIPVPAGTFGVAIIPPIGAPPAGVTLKVKTVSGDSGIYVSTQQPSIIEWDTVNAEVPADIYLVCAGGDITVGVQFL